MAQWAPVAQAGIGLLGGLFGGHHGPSMSDQVMKVFLDSLKESMNLYNRTDVHANDEKALAEMQASIQKQTMAMLGAYDATASAAGSQYGKADTMKDRARTQIAEDQAQRVGLEGLNLRTTEAQRQAALLPGNSGAAGLAQSIDQRNAMQDQNLQSGLGTIAGAIPWGQVFSSHNSTGGAVGNAGGWHQGPDGNYVPG